MWLRPPLLPLSLPLLLPNLLFLLHLPYCTHPNRHFHANLTRSVAPRPSP